MPVRGIRLRRLWHREATATEIMQHIAEAKAG